MPHIAPAQVTFVFAQVGLIVGLLLGLAIAWRTVGRPEAQTPWRWALWCTLPETYAGLCAAVSVSEEGYSAFYGSIVGAVVAGAIGYLIGYFIALRRQREQQ